MVQRSLKMKVMWVAVWLHTSWGAYPAHANVFPQHYCRYLSLSHLFIARNYWFGFKSEYNTILFEFFVVIFNVLQSHIFWTKRMSVIIALLIRTERVHYYVGNKHFSRPCYYVVMAWWWPPSWVLQRTVHLHNFCYLEYLILRKFF